MNTSDTSIQRLPIDLPVDDLVLHATLIGPSATVRPRAGIVIFHDAMGVGAQSVETAQRLAHAGYVALVADLYGTPIPPGDTVTAMRLMESLRSDPPTWRRRARTMLDTLAARPEVDAERLAAVGHCFGGSTALELMRDGAPLKAVVSLHGVLATVLPLRPGATRCQVLVCTGADDPLVPPAQVDAFLEEARQAALDCQTIIYSGARHAFTNPLIDRLGLPAMAYHPLADRRSWAALIAHLEAALASEGTATHPDRNT